MHTVLPADAHEGESSIRWSVLGTRDLPWSGRAIIIGSDSCMTSQCDFVNNTRCHCHHATGPACPRLAGHGSRGRPDHDRSGLHDSDLQWLSNSTRTGPSHRSLDWRWWHDANVLGSTRQAHSTTVEFLWLDRGSASRTGELLPIHSRRHREDRTPPIRPGPGATPRRKDPAGNYVVSSPLLLRNYYLNCSYPNFLSCLQRFTNLVDSRAHLVSCFMKHSPQSDCDPDAMPSAARNSIPPTTIHRTGPYCWKWK